MKYLLLNIIRFYWFVIPKNKRRNCIFEKSCSNHVYSVTKNKGLVKGLKELNFRIKNCQPEFDIYTDFETKKRKMILKYGSIIEDDQIAKRLK